MALSYSQKGLNKRLIKAMYKNPDLKYTDYLRHQFETYGINSIENRHDAAKRLEIVRKFIQKKLATDLEEDEKILIVGHSNTQQNMADRKLR